MSNNIQWPELGGGGGGAVDSVNGQTGVVVLNKSDIGLGNVDNKSLTAQNLAEKDPTGFPNRTDSAITFDDFTRTLFISATGASFDVWVRGTQFTFPNLIAIGKQIPPITGLWWFYFDITGDFKVTNSFTPDLFTQHALVAVLYWNQSLGTHTYFGDERHGLMDVDTHSYLHTVFGARYISGLALQGFVPDGSGGFDNNAQFSSDIGQIRDEDLLHSISGQSQFPVLYRVGDDWYKKTPDNYPVIWNGTAGYTGTTIAYNQYVAPNWQLTPVTDNNFVCIHLFATNDVDAGVVAILGTNQYANAPQARAGAETEINTISGLPFAEFTAIGTVIFQTSSAYTNTPKAKVVSSDPTTGEIYIDFRGEQLYTPSGVASSHSLLSNLGADDHLQYHNDVRGDARYLQLTGGTISGNTIVSGSASVGQSLMRVTNTGAGDSFVVEDSANPDSTPFKIDANGFIYVGSLLATSGVSGKMQFLDSVNASFECKAGATNSLKIGANTTSGNIVSSYQGSLTISTDEIADTISIYPASAEVLGASIFTKCDGTNRLTGINTVTPTEALEVSGNVKVSGSVIASNIPYIPPVYGSEASARAVFGSSTLQNYGGMTSGNTGTNTLANYSSATAIGRIPHVTYTTTSTAGSTTGHRLIASFYALGTGSRFSTTFQVSDASPIPLARQFCGLNTSTSATAINGSANNNPLVTSLTNFVALASDAGAGDTNFCIYHNAGTAGATTRIDLGANFPVGNTGEIYHVTFFNPKGSLNMFYEVTAIVGGYVARGEITTNLPNSAVLYFHCERFNGGTANNVRLEAGSLLSWVL
jgi:hypothetical protein